MMWITAKTDMTNFKVDVNDTAVDPIAERLVKNGQSKTEGGEFRQAAESQFGCLQLKLGGAMKEYQNTRSRIHSRTCETKVEHNPRLRCRHLSLNDFDGQLQLSMRFGLPRHTFSYVKM